MMLSGRAWLLIALALAVAGAAAIWTRPRPATTPLFVDHGSEPAGLAPQPIQSLRSEDSVDGRRFLIRNLIDGPIEARCDFTKAINIHADPPLPRRLVLPARAEWLLTVLAPAAAGIGMQAEISCVAMVGDPAAPAPDGVAYALPFYPATSFSLAQGFNGPVSHNEPSSRYSLDLSVPEGTPVLAARAGVVMEVEDEFHGHGVDLERYGDRANYVRVLHDDGSMAVYAHLAPGTVIVRAGERVQVGTYLARSGNTGFTTGPHLHFTVQKNVGLALVAIPFTMAGVDTSAKP